MTLILLQASGKKIPYELCARRPGDVASSYATAERAEKELGWKAKLSLLDMCKCAKFEFFSLTP